MHEAYTSIHGTYAIRGEQMKHASVDYKVTKLLRGMQHMTTHAVKNQRREKTGVVL